MGGGVYVLTSCNFKTCVNVPHVNKTVTGVFFFGGGSIGLYRYTPRRYAPDRHIAHLQTSDEFIASMLTRRTRR